MVSLERHHDGVVNGFGVAGAHGCGHGTGLARLWWRVPLQGPKERHDGWAVERAIDGETHPAGVVPVMRARVQDVGRASDAVTSAVVGFVVALMTSLGVSLACFAYLR